MKWFYDFSMHLPMSGDAAAHFIKRHEFDRSSDPGGWRLQDKTYDPGKNPLFIPEINTLFSDEKYELPDTFLVVPTQPKQASSPGGVNETRTYAKGESSSNEGGGDGANQSMREVIIGNAEDLTGEGIVIAIIDYCFTGTVSLDLSTTHECTRLHGDKTESIITGHTFSIASKAAAIRCNVSESASPSAIIAALIWCAKQVSIDIINVSYTVPRDDDLPTSIPLALTRAVEYCNTKNKLIVAAIGNDGNMVSSLALCSDVLAVGGTRAATTLWINQFSSVSVNRVDCIARGYGAMASAGGMPSTFSGSSLATPIISASLALHRQYRIDSQPDPNLKSLLMAQLRGEKLREDFLSTQFKHSQVPSKEWGKGYFSHYLKDN